MIGHSPFTMDDIFAARFEKNGMPVLRMYAYERIRGVVYQMDFWLDDETPALNCHMAVHNPAAEVVPMYWWTNMASPLYPDGRLLVEAHKAYSYNRGAIEKADIPFPEKGAFPAYDPIGTDWLNLLKDSLKKPGGENWYTYYCIALLEREADRMDLARKALNKSLKQKGTASNYYAKSTVQLLITCKAWKKAEEQIAKLAPEIQKESRIQLCRIQALHGLGRYEEALLEADGGFVLDDVREGEVNMGRLWSDLHEIVTGEKAEVPQQFDFDALGMG